MELKTKKITVLLDNGYHKEKQVNQLSLKIFQVLYKHKLFRVIAFNGKTELIVTNDLSQESTFDTQPQVQAGFVLNSVNWIFKKFNRKKYCLYKNNMSKKNIALGVFVVVIFAVFGGGFLIYQTSPQRAYLALSNAIKMS